MNGTTAGVSFTGSTITADHAAPYGPLEPGGEVVLRVTAEGEVGWSVEFGLPEIPGVRIYSGGTNQSMVVSWPARIKDKGALREQFIHVIDVVPTILEAAGIRPPQNGRKIPVLNNYVFSLMAGTVWYLQFFFYQIGESKMGEFKFSSWTLHMASIIIFSSLWGIFLKEWKGSSTGTRTKLGFGLATLILTLGMVAGGWIKFVFMPDVEADYLSSGLTMPQGTPAEVTAEGVRKLEESLGTTLFHRSRQGVALTRASKSATVTFGEDVQQSFYLQGQLDLERDLQQARRVTMDDVENKGIGSRMAESLARVLSPVL
mgnify:CR=1 FL=1